MQVLVEWITGGPTVVAWVVLLIAFAILAKGADFFVDSAVVMAARLHIPHLVIGIVLVSFATTTPELAVSVVAALEHRPEMALGNAVGSVICNCGLALALCGLCSRRPVPVQPQVLRLTGTVLLGVCALLLVFVFRDNTLTRWEGLVLMGILAGYLGVLLSRHGRRDSRPPDPVAVSAPALPGRPLRMVLLLFLASLGIIILASRLIVTAATTIALQLGIPEAAIALTVVALGTSIPEVATSIIAAVKGQGALSVGNILGANIMNICWVAGASALINPLSLARREIAFMFPAMFIIVIVTLFVLRSSHLLSRREGGILLLLYALYLAGFVLVFGPAAG